MRTGDARLMGLIALTLLLALLPSVASAAVTVLDTGMTAGDQTSVGELTTAANFTVSSGATTIVCAVGHNQISGGTPTFTWDPSGANQPFDATQDHYQPGGANTKTISVATLANPMAGASKAIKINIGATGFSRANVGCFTVTGGSQISNAATHLKGTCTAAVTAGACTGTLADSLPTLTVPSGSGCITAAFAHNDSGYTWSHTGSTTQQYIVTPFWGDAGSSGDSGSSDVHSWDLNGGGPALGWVMSGLTICAAAAGAPNFQPTYPLPLSPLGGPK